MSGDFRCSGPAGRYYPVNVSCCYCYDHYGREQDGRRWQGHPSPSLKPFSELIKRLWPRRSMATGRRLQRPSRPRAARAHSSRIDRGNLRSITKLAPPLLPGPRCPATAARRSPIGRRQARLPGFAWSVGQLRRGVAGGLAPGAGRCRFPSDLFWRGEGAAGGNRAREDGATQPVLEKFIDPFLISGTHSFLRWGRLKGRDGG